MSTLNEIKLICKLTKQSYLDLQTLDSKDNKNKINLQCVPYDAPTDLDIPQQEFDYCINLFWISKNIQQQISQTDIEHVKARCNKWVLYNPGKVYFWTDRPGDFSSDAKFTGLVKVSDYREIKIGDVESIEQKNNNRFLEMPDCKVDTPTSNAHPDMLDKCAQIYLRVDYVKNLIAHYHMLSNQYKYIIITDLDISDNSEVGNINRPSCKHIENSLVEFKKDYIFDNTTMKHLNFFGIVFSCGTAFAGGFENSFIIFENNEDNKLILLYLMIYGFLKFYMNPPRVHYDTQMIYGLYKPYYAILLMLKNYLEIHADYEIKPINQNNKSDFVIELTNIYFGNRRTNVTTIRVETSMTPHYQDILKNILLEQSAYYLSVYNIKSEELNINIDKTDEECVDEYINRVKGYSIKNVVMPIKGLLMNISKFA